MENEIIVKLIQDGIDTKNNFELLYSRNVRFIHMMINKFGWLDSDDLLQESFFVLHDAVYSFVEERDNFLTWFGNLLKWRYIKFSNEVRRNTWIMSQNR